jgi:hypothetical protein
MSLQPGEKIAFKHGLYETGLHEDEKALRGLTSLSSFAIFN